MKRVNVKIRVGLFLIIVAFLAACETKTTNDEAAYKTDAAASQTVNQANIFLQNRQRLPPETFSKLKKLYEQYPRSKTVADAYRAALVAKEDWATLIDVIQRTPADKLTTEDKLDRIKASIKLGRYNYAADELKALPATENGLEVDILSANANFYLGNYDASKALLDKNWAQVVSAKRVDEITMRALVYFYQGDSDKAVELLNNAIEYNPDYFPAFNALSRVYAAKGDVAKADAYLKDVQKIFDKVTADERRKVQLVDKSNKLQEAYQDQRFQEVVDLANEILVQANGKEKAVLYQYQYQSYQALGKQKEAQEVLAKARQLQQ